MFHPSPPPTRPPRPSMGAGDWPEWPYLEDDNPGVANVVKVDGALVGVGTARPAHIVVAVPVDTEPAGVEVLATRPKIINIILGQAALAALLLERRDLVAAHDAIVP